MTSGVLRKKTCAYSREVVMQCATSSSKGETNLVASRAAIATSVLVTHLLNIHANESPWKAKPRTHAAPEASPLAPRLKHYGLFSEALLQNVKPQSHEAPLVMGLPAWKLWTQIYTISTFRFPQVRKSSQMNEQLLGSALWWGSVQRQSDHALLSTLNGHMSPLVGTLKDAFAVPVVRQEMASTITINRIWARGEYDCNYPLK